MNEVKLCFAETRLHQMFGHFIGRQVGRYKRTKHFRFCSEFLTPFSDNGEVKQLVLFS